MILSTNFAMAEENEDQLDSDFQLNVMAGFSSLDQDGNYVYSPTETDSLIQDGNDWNAWTVAVGVGYLYPLQEADEDEEVNWFTAITPQLNLYYLNGNDIDGDIYRYENPDLDHASYTSEFSSTRLMLDFDLTVMAIEKFSVFALAGLGVAWNNTELSVNYDEALKYPDWSLDSTTTTAFAYEFGAGVAYDITDDWGISLEYLYANLGDANVSGYAPIGEDKDDLVIDSSDIDMSSQSIILGMTFAL
jgi:outer membrane autotransporter protein